jgi:5'-nucleotidase
MTMNRAVKTPQARAWQRMLSGRRLDLLDPSPLDIEIEDIAHGLARVARWNGQTSGEHAFSVAQHCLLVEELCCHFKPNLDARLRCAALLHDAAEYVVGDMISPFKAALGIDYRSFEDKLMHAVHIRFSLPVHLTLETQKLIKRADKASAFLEATQLAGFEDMEAAKFFGRPRGLSGRAAVKFLKLQPWPVHRAQEIFLKKFSTLQN